jgi:hypothetical protein
VFYPLTHSYTDTKIKYADAMIQIIVKALSSDQERRDVKNNKTTFDSGVPVTKRDGIWELSETIIYLHNLQIKQWNLKICFNYFVEKKNIYTAGMNAERHVYQKTTGDGS